MIEWLKMGGYGFFVWNAYAMLALAVIVELVMLRRLRAQARERVLEAIEEDAR